MDLLKVRFFHHGVALLIVFVTLEVLIVIVERFHERGEVDLDHVGLFDALLVVPVAFLVVNLQEMYHDIPLKSTQELSH